MTVPEYVEQAEQDVSVGVEPVESARRRYALSRATHVQEARSQILAMNELRALVPESLTGGPEDKKLLVAILDRAGELAGLTATTTETPGVAELICDSQTVVALLRLFSAPLTFDFEDAKWSTVLRRCNQTELEAESGLCQFYSRVQSLDRTSCLTILSQFNVENPHQMHWTIPMQEEVTKLTARRCQMMYHGCTVALDPVDCIEQAQAGQLHSKLANWLELNADFKRYEWLALRQQASHHIDSVRRLGNIERFLITLGGGTELALNSALGSLTVPPFACSQELLAIFERVDQYCKRLTEKI